MKNMKYFFANTIATLIQNSTDKQFYIFITVKYFNCQKYSLL